MNCQAPRIDSMAHSAKEVAFAELGKKLPYEHQNFTSQDKYSKDGTVSVSFQNNRFENRRTNTFWNEKNAQPPVWINSNWKQYEREFGDKNHGLPNNQFGLNINKLNVCGTEPYFNQQALTHSNISFSSQPSDLPWLKHKMSLWRKKNNLQDRYSRDGMLMVSLRKNSFKKGCKRSWWNCINIVPTAGNCYQPTQSYNYQTGNFCNMNPCEFYPQQMNSRFYFSDTPNVETNGTYGQPHLNSVGNVSKNQQNNTTAQTESSGSSCSALATKANEDQPDVIFEKVVSAEEKRVLAVVTITSDTDDSATTNNDLIQQSTDHEKNKNHVITSPIDIDDSLLNQTADDLEKTLGFRPAKLHLLGLNPSWDEQQKLMTSGHAIIKGRYMEDEDFILLENLKILQQDFHLNLYDALLGNRRKKHLQQVFAETHFYIRLGRNLGHRTLHSAYRRSGSLLLIHLKIKELNAEFLSRKAGMKKMKATFETPDPKSKGEWIHAEKVQLLKAMDVLIRKKKVQFSMSNSFWSEIAQSVPSRTARQCKSRWFQFHSFNFKATAK